MKGFQVYHTNSGESENNEHARCTPYNTGYVNCSLTNSLYSHTKSHYLITGYCSQSPYVSSVSRDTHDLLTLKIYKIHISMLVDLLAGRHLESVAN